MATNEFSSFFIHPFIINSPVKEYAFFKCHFKGYLKILVHNYKTKLKVIIKEKYFDALRNFI